MRRYARRGQDIGDVWAGLLAVAVVGVVLSAVSFVLRAPGAWPEALVLRVSNLADDSLLVDARWQDDLLGVTGPPARGLPRGGDFVFRLWKEAGICLRVFNLQAERALPVFLPAGSVAPGDTIHVEVRPEGVAIRTNLRKACPPELARDSVRYAASSALDLDAPVRIELLRELRDF